jgi:uncharacterized membrane protein
MLDYIKALFIILALDSVYLYFIADAFGSMVKSIQHESMSVRYGSAFIVYALLAIGLVNISGFNVKKAALLGAVTYGVFDFTNHAVFRNYNIVLAITDTIWGALLMGLSAYFYKLIIL